MSKTTRQNQVRVPWAAWWPLILYFFLTLVIAAVVFFLVDQSSFSTTSRRPSVRQADGSVTFVPYMFLQSDVTSLLSFSLAVLRFVGVLSVGTMTSRCIYFLMGKEEGIPLKDIKWILGFGLPVRPQGTQRAAIFLVATILLTAFPSQFSSPILTGSITWDPSMYSVLGLKPVTGIPLATSGAAWTNYQRQIGVVNAVTQQAVGLAGTAWGNTDNSVSKSMVRILPTIRYLSNGTELANVTAPYFAVDRVEWVQNVAADVTDTQIDRVVNGPNKFIQGTADGPTFGLIPDSQWGPAMNNLTFPHPSIQSETRMLVILVDRIPPNATCPHITGYCGEISPKIDLHPVRYNESTNCLAFARVTYHAGAAVCRRCRLSNRFVFTNTTALELQKDVMTTDTLALMSLVSNAMVFANFSLPTPINNIDVYVTEGLSRSYQASWSALHQKFGVASTSLSTNVMISVPSSRANVQKWRIFVWLMINIMFTLSGLISFIAIRQPVIVDVAIASMLLETDATIQAHPRLGDMSVVGEEDQELRLHLKYLDNGHRVLEVINPSSDTTQ